MQLVEQKLFYFVWINKENFLNSAFFGAQYRLVKWFMLKKINEKRIKIVKSMGSN